jgi:molybdopterin synthase sulfur carrier subunit
MIIHIRAFANFREILGKDLNIEVKDRATIRDLLDELVSSRPGIQYAIFEESGRIREYVILMKNRKNIESMSGLDTELSEGDEVAILPPVAGG